MKQRIILGIMVLLALVASACGNANKEGAAGALNTTDDLIVALQDQGIAVSKGESFEQPFFSVPALSLEPGIQVFEYADESAAQSDAAMVAPDGSSVGTSMPFWVGDPHFFQSGKFIVLYLGSEESSIAAIEAVMGPQFAGR
jgi:hypothetical protein